MPDETITTETPAGEQPRPRFQFIKKRFPKLPLDLLPLIVLVIVVFLVILFANDWKFWDGMGPQEETNDAYIRADVTPLSTKVSGTVAKVLIDDFDHVQKGQLLVELRNDDFTAREQQAKSTYNQSLANEEVIKRQIEVQKESIADAGLSVDVGKQDITRAVASVGASSATLQSSIDSLAAAKSEKAQAEAKLQADKAVELRAKQERDRQELLFKDQASTQQTIEQVVADDDRAKALVAADRADIERLKSLIQERSSEIARQRELLTSAHAEDTQSQLRVSARNTELAAARRTLEVLQQQLKQSDALAQANLDAWNTTKVELDYTKIRAPVDGTLSERRVRAGQQVNAGTQVVTIVSSVPWVIASYRETQTRKMEVGDRAEVSVDALGSAVLKGQVQSMSPASEAQFALLPPDNPSGNFTKITQRMPIKIVFDRDQKLLSRIKPGMTVIAKVWTSK
jgi:membrane fusion protein (multidrug efflux system)